MREPDDDGRRAAALVPTTSPLQPDDGLDGLDWGEQFHGGTQLRYQLNGSAWAMSLYAANYVPNAPGQVERGAAPSSCTSTPTCGCGGTGARSTCSATSTPNPDPIVRDNIMFSAFLGDVAQHATRRPPARPRFDEPGSLTFVWKDGRTFAYDHHSIVAAVQANFERSRLGFFPCEPGWSFTVCNIMGAQALHGHDTLHGTDDWARGRRPLAAARSTRSTSRPTARYAHIRSNHVGLSWDTGEVPGGHYFANGTHRFADILPDHARRAQALDLRGARAEDGRAVERWSHDGRLDARAARRAGAQPHARRARCCRGSR